MDSASSPSVKSGTALGVLCGTGAALCWALGFVAARHGIDAGVPPPMIALHRYLWTGLVLLPLVARNGFADIRALGWRRSFLLTLFGGLPQAALS